MFARFRTIGRRKELGVLSHLCLDDDASTAVEYAVTLALISVAMLASVLAVGSSSAELFRSLARELNSAEDSFVSAPTMPAPAPKPSGGGGKTSVSIQGNGKD